MGLRNICTTDLKQMDELGHKMSRDKYIEFLTWALPGLSMKYRGFRKVKRQVCRRIDGRMRELGLSGLDGYKSYLISNKEEWRILDQFCRIHISRFFRDARVFQTLADFMLPELARKIEKGNGKILSVWSLGCASGEEAYTFKLIWDAALQEKFPRLTMKILGTDIDEHMLERARIGLYQKSGLKEVPDHLIEFGFEITGENCLLKKGLKANTLFLLQDVRKELPETSFHIIACRNLVFTYYDENLQRKLLPLLIQKLLPGGILVLGKNESLPGDFPDLIQNKKSNLIYHRIR